MRKILFVIAIGFIAYGYYQIKKNEPNKKAIRITKVDTIEVFENNFDSTWEVYGCKYYGYKEQENGK
jgi:uncharacterized membrane protein